MYRDHPDLQKLLVQVEDPTDQNLRKAGMVRTRLVGGARETEELQVILRGQEESCDSE
jgi:hypothetical protein